MTKAPINLQDLRRRLYVKAKAEPTWRFWGLYVHVCKWETLGEAYLLAKANDGAPGSDGVTFVAVEAGGVEEFLNQLHKELADQTYRPQRARKVEIPKGGGKMRQLSIPSIRDRVVQGALKADPGADLRGRLSTGVVWIPAEEVSARCHPARIKAILEGKTYVIDFDLRSYFDAVRHHIVLEKVARRVDDNAVL
jgi:RNA-directed DNA polymerase